MVLPSAYSLLSLLLVALVSVSRGDIVVENDLIDPDQIYDFIVLQDSDHWWLSTNVTKYYCIMRGLWNPQNHPKRFPQLARMSNPLVYSGTKEFRPWLLNRQTTWGVEKIAETGFTDIFRQEIDASGLNVFDIAEGQGFFIDKEDPEKNFAFLPGFKVSPEYPFLSGISAMNPSPDWYTGFYLLDVIDEYERTYWNRIIVHTYPWDAGTDAGTTYTSIDEDLDPPLNVERIFPSNAPPDGIFISDDGDVRPVAEWDCALHVCAEGEEDCEPANWPPANGCDLLKYPGCEAECDPTQERCQECEPKARDGERQVFYRNCCQSNYKPLYGNCDTVVTSGAFGISTTMAGLVVTTGMMTMMMLFV